MESWRWFGTGNVYATLPVGHATLLRGKLDPHNPIFIWKGYGRLGLTDRNAGICVTSFSRKASTSSPGKTQKNDFNTTVVSPMHVFRS